MPITRFRPVWLAVEGSEAGAPADVLRGATIVPAEFMGLGDRLGSVGEGKTASRVLVRANPLKDVGNAEQIEGVFLRRRYFGRDDLGRLLVEARALAQPAALRCDIHIVYQL